MASATLPRLLCVALLGAATLASATGLYQWKDAKGVTHYTDAPPPKGSYQTRNVVVPAGTAPAPADAATPASTIASANCTLAKANRDRLQAGGAIGPDANHDGKPDSTFSAEQMVQQKQLAEADIQRWCKTRADAPAP